MTDSYTGPIIADDVDDTPASRLDREADAILQREEMRLLGVRPVRQALKEDAQLVRDWGKARVGRLRDTVEEEPVRYSLYALGIGVLIGLLAAR